MSERKKSFLPLLILGGLTVYLLSKKAMQEVNNLQNMVFSPVDIGLNTNGFWIKLKIYNPSIVPIYIDAINCILYSDSNIKIAETQTTEKIYIEGNTTIETKVNILLSLSTLAALPSLFLNKSINIVYTIITKLGSYTDTINIKYINGKIVY